MAKTWTSAFYIYLIFSCQMLPLCTSMRSEADFEDEIEATPSKDANALRSVLGLKCGVDKAPDETHWVMNPLNAALHGPGGSDEDLEPTVECESSKVESGSLRSRATKVGDWISLGWRGADRCGRSSGRCNASGDNPYCSEWDQQPPGPEGAQAST
ncbi:unnamed protein product [Symbiodinium necroappetens]|uniref:Uncharacterized protein n=1 Tax=Symbiodinium necroappetens TaxID=1628268 RepID=A0A812ZJA7_9DINO|nr:unnamed protein product [Symbiodinium necroappetens]